MATETVKIEGLEGVLKTLKELPAEVVSKNGGPVRSALAKAARMMRDKTQQNLQSIIDAPNEGGEQTESTGLLKKNIIAKRGRLGGGEKGELYSVRVRNKVYPDKKGKRVSTAQVARLLEYGSERLNPPKPFMRPAFDSEKSKVISLFVSELNKKLGAIVRKLARKNRVPA